MLFIYFKESKINWKARDSFSAINRDHGNKGSQFVIRLIMIQRSRLDWLRWMCIRKLRSPQLKRKLTYLFLMNFWGQKVRKMMSIPELKTNKPKVHVFVLLYFLLLLVLDNRKWNSFTEEGEKSHPVKLFSLTFCLYTVL